MKIAQIIEDVKVIDYTHEGLGIARVQKQVIFIYQAIKGEILTIKIIKIKNKIPYAQIIAFEKKSPKRKIISQIEALPGCDLQHMTYEEQLNLKKITLTNTIKKSGLEVLITEIVPAPQKIRYRNKITFYFGQKDAKLYLGMKKEKTNEIKEIFDCFLISQAMNKIKDEILQILNNISWKNHQRLNLESLMIRENVHGEYLVYLKTNLQNNQFLQKYFHQNSLPKIIAFYLEDQQKQVTYVKNAPFFQQVQDFSFLISPQAFFQVNTDQTINLYNEVAKQITVTNGVLLDAYCGSGTIGQYVHEKVKKVVGMEINQAAVRDAKQNAKFNQVSNYEYFQGDIKKQLAQIYVQQKNSFDVVVIDPPRKGIDLNFIKLLKQYQPQEIIYISCQPATLMRDLQLLKETYQIKMLKAYDMFPQTHHLEVLVKLVRLKS